MTYEPKRMCCIDCLAESHYCDFAESQNRRIAESQIDKLQHYLSV